MGVPCVETTCFAALPCGDGLNFFGFVGEAVLSFFWLMCAISFHRYVSLVSKRLFRERREPHLLGRGGEIFRLEVNRLWQAYNSHTVLTV